MAKMTSRNQITKTQQAAKPAIAGIPADFVVFSKSRSSVFRFKIRHDNSWDMLIRRESHWAFHDNVGLATAFSYYTDPDHEVFLGYE